MFSFNVTGESFSATDIPGRVTSTPWEIGAARRASQPRHGEESTLNRCRQCER